MRILAILFACLFPVISPVSADEVWRHYANGNDIVDMARNGDFIWCATGGSVVRWNTRDSTYTQFTTSEGLPGPNSELIALDREGNPWVSFSELPGVASHYDGTVWHTFDSENGGLSGKKITAILPDSKGNVWFGTESSGIYRYDGSAWESFAPEETYACPPRDVAIDKKGVVWVATSIGAYIISGENLSSCSLIDRLKNINVRCIEMDSEGILWFGTNQGVFSFDGIHWTAWSRTDGLANNSVTALAFGPDKAVWAATDGGISRFDGNAWKSYKEADGLITSKSAGIAVDWKGRVWVCHPSEELGVS